MASVSPSSGVGTPGRVFVSSPDDDHGVAPYVGSNTYPLRGKPREARNSFLVIPNLPSPPVVGEVACPLLWVNKK
jgi:hypothetical protein